MVTGCAGFVGSHLAERLIRDGHSVIGVDSFLDYYPRRMKQKNMEAFIGSGKFRFVEGDLSAMDIAPLMKGVDAVFHQAAQAGVRESWGSRFDVYVRNNVLATQRLLEACKGASVRNFIYASSSSVYGDAESLPTMEDAVPKPVSPYGVSKLAGEHLCYLYSKSYGIPVSVLRYFTVYGPRQRPDMAFNKFIRAVLGGRGITIFGDGSQTRDFTYVDDVVEANLLALKNKESFSVFNIGGGSRIALNDAIGIIERVAGKKAKLKHLAGQKGDARHTSADISRARRALGYSPKVGIEEGLRREIEWVGADAE